MPYWIQATLAATPALAWMFLGVGVPWALVMLPCRDWRDGPLLACLTLALGPSLLTAWMFILGSLPNALLRLEWILAGTGVIAITGWWLAWRKRRLLTSTLPGEPVSLAADEKLLIALVAIAWLVLWFSTAYWPFMAYDTLWVYGYEGRLYTLVNHIPPTIGYYPQFLPLQYSYLQLAVGGINDHAARAVVPWLHLGSILAVYTLGNRLFNRRTGILAAALWALYPHVGEWARFGDLEIPLTFLFTGAAALFLMAWVPQPNETSYRRRYALIAGLLLGAGLWAKPTMGAFVWGLLLLAGLELARARFNGTVWKPRLWLIIWTGVAALPLGAVWYIRNALLGHPPLVLPTGFWLTLAARSGVEFGWPLLALLTLVIFLFWRSRHITSLPLSRRPVLIGLAFSLIGLLPSILVPHRMGALEWAALALGGALLYTALMTYARLHWDDTTRLMVGKVGWMLALALPYFITWFYSYSYHYRLSFAIVPLMLMPTALILAQWLKPQNWRPHVRRAYLVITVLIALPGIAAPLYDSAVGWDWLWTNKLPDDMARYESGNPALIAVVRGLQAYQDQHGTAPVVAAPGVQRLPFFFPIADIRIQSAPTHFAQLKDVTYYIYGLPESPGMYSAIGAERNQVVSALSVAWDDEFERNSLRPAWWHDDGNFKYTVYELFLQRRFIQPKRGVRPKQPVIFGSFLRYLGHDIGGSAFAPNRKIVLNLYWQVIAPPPKDYLFYVHLRDSQGKLWDKWDGPVTQTEDGNYYSTLFWQTGEYISDERIFTLNNRDTPLGDGYQLVIGIYDLQTGARLPFTIDGQPAGEGFTIPEKISVVQGDTN